MTENTKSLTDRIEEALERLDFDVHGDYDGESGLLDRRQAARAIAYRIESAYHPDGGRKSVREFAAEVNARMPQHRTEIELMRARNNKDARATKSTGTAR